MAAVENNNELIAEYAAPQPEIQLPEQTLPDVLVNPLVLIRMLAEAAVGPRPGPDAVSAIGQKLIAVSSDVLADVLATHGIKASADEAVEQARREIYANSVAAYLVANDSRFQPKPDLGKAAEYTTPEVKPAVRTPGAPVKKSLPHPEIPHLDLDKAAEYTDPDHFGPYMTASAVKAAKTPSPSPAKAKQSHGKRIDWFELDQDAAEEAAIKKSSRDELLKKVPLSVMVKLSEVPTEELPAAIADAMMNYAASQVKLAKLDVADQKAEAAKKAAEEKAAKEAAAAKKAYMEKYHTKPPALPERPVSHSDAKVALKNAREGFYTKGKPVVKITANNKHPERLKKNTSATWLFSTGGMNESEDFFLWSANTDEKGRLIPIGWVKVKNYEDPDTLKFRINWASPYIHTLHEDGTWSHEEATYDEDSGALISTRQITVAELRDALRPKQKYHSKKH